VNENIAVACIKLITVLHGALYKAGFSDKTKLASSALAAAMLDDFSNHIARSMLQDKTENR